jgi:tryptophan synthase alpha chain
MNRIDHLFQHKSGQILSVYFTAGHPTVDSAVTIIKALADAGADMVEIGMPFSDPMADGPVIQSSSTRALKNGMSLKLLFSQLKDIRKQVDIPLLLMGYLNPVLQYGIEKFCSDSAALGIDGIILPDLPLKVFNEEYRQVFLKNNLHNIFLISPQTSEERIRQIDGDGSGFIYMVSSSSTTGVKSGFSDEQTGYFTRIQGMKLKNPTLVGFGISSHQSFNEVCMYSKGAIIGSAFVKMLEESKDIQRDVAEFVKTIRGK